MINTKYIHRYNVILNKTVTKLVTILTIYFFPYRNPTSYLKRLWPTIIECFKRNFHIPVLLLQCVIFGFLEADGKALLILNHFLLLLKYYVYVPRSSKVLSFEALLKSIIKVYKLETNLSQSGKRKKNTK